MQTAPQPQARLQLTSASSWRQILAQICLGDMLIFYHVGGEIMRGFSKTDALGFFLTGAAVGAAVTLVFAPKSGAQTRKDIRRFSRNAANRIDNLQRSEE